MSFCVFVCFLEVFATFGGNCSKTRKQKKKHGMEKIWVVGGVFWSLSKFLLLLVENLENPFRKHNKMLRNLNCSLVFLCLLFCGPPFCGCPTPNWPSPLNK